MVIAGLFQELTVVAMTVPRWSAPVTADTVPVGRESGARRAWEVDPSAEKGLFRVECGRAGSSG